MSRSRWLSAIRTDSLRRIRARFRPVAAVLLAGAVPSLAQESRPPQNCEPVPTISLLTATGAKKTVATVEGEIAAHESFRSAVVSSVAVDPSDMEVLKIEPGAGTCLTANELVHIYVAPAERPWSPGRWLILFQTGIIFALLWRLLRRRSASASG